MTRFPELAGLAEVAGLAGVSRKRAWQLSQHPDFPKPVQVLAMGPVWREADVRKFLDTPRSPGRRPRPMTEDLANHWAPLRGAGPCPGCGVAPGEQHKPHTDSRRISLELSHSWPGEMYLRFRPGHGPAVMVGVTETDLDQLRTLLGCPHETTLKETQQ